MISTASAVVTGACKHPHLTEISTAGLKEHQPPEPPDSAATKSNIGTPTDDRYEESEHDKLGNERDNPAYLPSLKYCVIRDTKKL